MKNLITFEQLQCYTSCSRLIVIVICLYARVLKDTERLMHSVSAQVSYYNSLIQSNPEWEYAGVYADSSISGTGIKVCDEF